MKKGRIKTMEVKIERGIPLPQKSLRIRKAYDLYDQMEIGDSVLLSESERTMLHDAIRAIEGTSKKKLVTRKENNGFRVWRIGERKNKNA